MTFYDIQTVYLVVGFLYVMLPATAWMVLSSQRSVAAVLWCSGGLLFSLSCFFFAIRGIGPDWLTYSGANYLLWIANILPVMALRHQLQQPRRLGFVVIGVAIAILIFEYINLVMEDRVLRFLWSLFILVGLFAYVHRLALRIGQAQRIRSATWLSMGSEALPPRSDQRAWARQTNQNSSSNFLREMNSILRSWINPVHLKKSQFQNLGVDTSKFGKKFT